MKSLVLMIALAFTSVVLAKAPSVENSSHISFSDFSDMKPQGDRQSDWYVVYDEAFATGYWPNVVPLYISTDLDHVDKFAVIDVHTEQGQKCGNIPTKVLSRMEYIDGYSPKIMKVAIPLPCLYDGTFKLRVAMRSEGTVHLKEVTFDRPQIAQRIAHWKGGFKGWQCRSIEEMCY